MKKKQWDEEMEELKAGHESEVQALKDRIRKEKSTSNAALSEQLRELEKDMEEQWKVKTERSVHQMEEKWRRKYSDLQVSKIYYQYIHLIGIQLIRISGNKQLLSTS